MLVWARSGEAYEKMVSELRDEIENIETVIRQVQERLEAVSHSFYKPIATNDTPENPAESAGSTTSQGGFEFQSTDILFSYFAKLKLEPLLRLGQKIV